MTHPLSRSTRAGLVITLAPLLVWGWVALTRLALACAVPVAIAWIPAVATSGVMIAATTLAMTATLDRPTRRYAGWLATLGIGADIAAAGVQHYLEALHQQPPAWLAVPVGGLPCLMGGLLVHVVGLVYAQRRREVVDAERARLERERADADAAAAAQRQRDKDAEDETRHRRDLARAAELADEAERAAVARQREADEAQRLSEAQTRVAAVVDEALTPPADLRAARERRATTPRKAAASSRAPLRDAAIRYLAAQHRDGVDLDTIGPAALDRAIGATGYSKRHIAAWREQVRTHEATG